MARLLMTDPTEADLNVIKETKTVEEYLRLVNYGDDPSYVPSVFAYKFVDFINMVSDGRGESSPTPVFHLKMLDNVGTSDTRVANLAARGTAKTSLLAEYLIFYIAIYGKLDGFGAVDVMFYVSDTMENGVKNLKTNMEDRYFASDFLQKYLPVYKFNQNELAFTNISGHRSYVRMFGASTGIRGFKAFGKRPQLALFDDLLSDKNAKSETILEDIENMIYKGANNALDPTHKKIIFSGTPFNQGDPLYKAVESKAWVSNVYPIAEEWPCSKEDFRGAWPERFSYEFMMDEWFLAVEDGQQSAFMQELMLQITNPEDRVVQDSDILFYSRNTLLQQKHNFNFYITTDFATSAARAADFSAISVWAVNSKNHRFWVDGILKRQTMDANMDDLFRLCHMYEPMSVGIETNGQQGGFIPWIRKEQLERNIYFDLAKSVSANGTGRVGILSPTNKNKLERFNTVLPLLKQGKIWLPEEMKEDPIIIEAVKELKGVTKRGMVSRYDDWLDTLSQMGLMEMWTPSTINNDGSIPQSADGTLDNFWSLHNQEEETSSQSSYYV